MDPEVDAIVLSYHDSLLRQSDVALLDGPHWLNDQIISFYFEYLSRDVYKDNESVLFVSPEVTQCLKMVSTAEVEMFLGPQNALDKQLILFALNDMAGNAAGGSHWSLLVWCKPTATFHHYDSSSPANHHVAEEMQDKLKGFFGCAQASLKETRCLQQSNCYDCGVHVIVQAEALAKHVTKSEGYENLESIKLIPRLVVTHKREHIQALVESLAEQQV